MADVFKERQLHKVARKMLLFWWEEMTWKRTSAHFLRFLASRQKHTLLNNALHCWMHFTFDNLLIANAKFQNDLHDAKAQYEAQKNETTAVDVENLQLIDRLHAMSSEIAHLKIGICDKEKQEEDLHRSLEDTAVIESSMRAELEQQHLHIEELELESIRLQKKLQLQSAEDTVGEAQHAMEIDGLEITMKDLHTQIEEKSSQIDSYAKALKDTAEKLEGSSDESQEQLSNAFEIAGSLRKILEDRENQFATLEGSCRRRELELGEVQRKLAVANNAFSETVETRDARIRELESRLTKKQNEVQDAQQEMQDLQIALDAKESLVRRLEYDMKLKSDRDSSRTKTFVSSLSSWSSSAGQLDAMSGFKNNTHSIQMESMKHVYMQTKAALQQGISPDHCVSGYRLSAFKVQTKPSWKLHSASPSLEDRKCTLLSLHHSGKDHVVGKGSTDHENQSEEMLHQQNTGKSRQNELLQYSATDATLQDRVIITHQGHESMNPPHNIDSGSMPNSEFTRSSNFKLFLEPVDSLHVEIQQLQARILERIKASASLNVEKGS